MATERAEELYTRIVAQGLPAIDALIEERESEAFFLDFKRSSDQGRNRRLSHTDRNNLAKAISGFGNSEGGVIVWGIDCSDVGEGDVARARFPLADAAAFRSWLEGAVSGCTVPGHDSVVSHAVPIDGTQEGFVVTHIPKSYKAPHQVTPELRYYMRAGSSFQPVPHGVLAGMFGRRPQPFVYSNYILAVPEVAAMRVSVSCGIALFNQGPGVARDTFVVVTVESLPGPNCEARFERPEANWEGNVAFGVRMSLVCKEGFRVPPDTHVQPVILHFAFAPPFERPLAVKILMGSDGGLPHRNEWHAAPADLQGAYEGVMARQFEDAHEGARRLLGVPPA